MENENTYWTGLVDQILWAVAAVVDRIIAAADVSAGKEAAFWVDTVVLYKTESADNEPFAAVVAAAEKEPFGKEIVEDSAGSSYSDLASIVAQDTDQTASVAVTTEVLMAWSKSSPTWWTRWFGMES